MRRQGDAERRRRGNLYKRKRKWYNHRCYTVQMKFNERRCRLLHRRLLAGLLAAALALMSMACAAAEETKFVEPTLAPDATPYDAEHPEILEDDMLYAPSVILIEASSGDVIYQKNADDVMYPASTTKILTVLLGIQLGDMNATVTVSETALQLGDDDATTMGLQLGEEINFHDLLVGTLIRSANEGANVIAEAVSGSISEFVDLMNRTAESYGCTNTHFTNPNGLHDPNHYTTARDMAIIAREAMKDETFREIAATLSYPMPQTNKQKARTLSLRDNSFMTPGTEDNPNKYYYPYGIGIKTGFTNAAGYCYVGAAEKDGVELITVVLAAGQRGRWADTIKLMDYGFSQYVNVTPIDLYEMNPITIQTTNYSLSDSDMGRLALLCQAADPTQTASITATQKQVESMAENLRRTCLITYTRDFVAPITAGEVLGVMTYFNDDGTAVDYNLTASRSIAVRENAPKTLEQIVAETEADPNPFPPLTMELVLYLSLPLVALAALVLLLRKLFRRRRISRRRVPKPTNRYLK